MEFKGAERGGSSSGQRELKGAKGTKIGKNSTKGSKQSVPLKRGKMTKWQKNYRVKTSLENGTKNRPRIRSAQARHKH